MPNIVNDMDVLIRTGDAVYDDTKKHYVDKDGVHLVTFQDVASGRFPAHPDERLVDYDVPELPISLRAFDL